MRRLAFLLLVWAGPAFDADLAAPPSAFELHYVPAIRNGLAADQFYGSRLIRNFDLHMAAVAQNADPRAAAAYLKEQVKDVRLEERALTDKQAAAVLAAGALAAPRQFNAAISRLEEIKPGLGSKILESFRSAPGSGAGSYKTATALTKAGEALRLSPTALTYNAKGEIDRLFDGK